MKIELQGSFGVYGVESFVQNLSSQLQKQRVEVSISPPFGNILRGHPARRISNAIDRSGDVLPRHSVTKPNLIHINYAFASLPLFLRLRSHVPLLYTVHGVPRPFLEPQIRYKIGYTLEKNSLKFVASRCAKVIAISRYVQRLLRDMYQLESQVIHNGVDPEIYHPILPGDRTKLRVALGLPRDKPIILFVGRLYPYKDPLTLVRSLSPLLSQIPNAFLSIVGEGPLKETMVAETSRMNLHRSVQFVRHLSNADLVKMIQASDVYVSTAPAEMFGFSVLEAMSCGIPVVAAKSGGPVETLAESGTFFEPGNAMDLAEKTARILKDPGLSEARAQAGRQIALRDYKWEDIANEYKAAYRSALR